MRIRSQLLIAFLLLAVLPLGGIVGFSYVNSQRAISRAAAAEAATLSRDMEDRMAAARASFQDRVGSLPWDTVLDFRGDMDEEELEERLKEELGEMAPMVESLTFTPRAPAPPAAPAPPVSGLEESATRAGGEANPPTPPTSEANPVESPQPTAEIRTRVMMLQIEDVEELEDPEVLAEILGDAPTIFGPEGVHKVGPFPEGVLPSEEMLELEIIGEDGLDEVILLPPPAFEGIPPEARDEAFRVWEEAAKIDLQSVKDELKRELEAQRRALQEERAMSVFGESAMEIRHDGEIIGLLKPQINPERLLEGVFRGPFADAIEENGEIPFAIDRQGRLYTGQEGDRHHLESLGIYGQESDSSWRSGEWVLATATDETTGLRLGVARPIGEALRELRASAVRNLSFGLLLIVFALLGILPVSQRLSNGVRQVAEGAERIARGDLETRLPVQGRGELAHLARAFNSMVHDVKDHQERLLAGERRRRHEEVERQLMQAELDRQRQELDEARAFQLSMLPRDLPDHDAWESAVHVETATEVGGDYYDFRLTSDGQLTAVIGDATGHGARAGTMVTVIKSLFSAQSTVDASPAAFLEGASGGVRRMELGRMAMALSVLSLGEDNATLSNAGMPPLLHHRRAEGEVFEILVPGMPLGGLVTRYEDRRFEVAPGDTLLLYSDGLPEQPGENGEPVGYDVVKETFEGAVDGSPEEIVAAMAAKVNELTGEEAPQDDVTFLVLRRRGG